MGNLFAMVTLKNSNSYTIHALKSFFECTRMEENDEFFLIDNDNSVNNQFSKYDRLKIINNEKPMSFSENVNQSIDWAIKKKKDLIFLSNDVIFTNNWFLPLSLDSENISMPSNNQIFQYESDLGILKLKTTMKLEDYNNNYELLDEIVITALGIKKSRKTCVPGIFEGTKMDAEGENSSYKSRTIIFTIWFFENLFST